MPRPSPANPARVGGPSVVILNRGRTVLPIHASRRRPLRPKHRGLPPGWENLKR
jgi:hypothetical protein